jgi:hypothetical protein
MAIFKILVQTSAVRTSELQTSAASASTQKFFGACLGDEHFFNGHKQDPPENSSLLLQPERSTMQTRSTMQKARIAAGFLSRYRSCVPLFWLPDLDSNQGPAD